MSRSIDLSGLLREMTDLRCLARLPTVSFTSHLASSHDPESDHAVQGAPEWFSNHDALALHASEPATLLDVSGPGVITRIWTARPQGVLRIYIDGQPAPSIELAMESLMGGSVAPFRAPFVFTAARGYDLYFPIPFSSACRVTLAGDTDSVYFHIDYRRYSAGTAVEPFSADALSRADCAIANAGALLSSADARPDAAELRGVRRSFQLSTADRARATATITASPGGGVLRRLQITGMGDDPRRLRATILAMRFDGHETVRVPLGDFFASGVALGAVHSIPIDASAHAGTLIARWPMPFAREAQIALESTGGGNVDLQLQIISDELPFTEQSLLFFAHWQAPETFSTKPARDWNLATIRGRGNYVGNVLNVVNRASDWWGEGDERIFIDGESQPSRFGTGTEDYYGYAWCSNRPFTTAYVGQPLATTRRNFGYSSLYRFHVLDVIPFQSSIRFDLEVLHWGPPVDVTYDAVSFWYARPGAQVAAPAPLPEQFRIPPLDTPTPAEIPEAEYDCS